MSKTDQATLWKRGRRGVSLLNTSIDKTAEDLAGKRPTSISAIAHTITEFALPAIWFRMIWGLIRHGS